MGSSSSSPIHAAIEARDVSALRKALSSSPAGLVGATGEAKGVRTPLHLAVCARSVVMAELLLSAVGGRDACAWVNHADEQGRTALAVAAELGHGDLVELLLGQEEVDVSVQDSDGRTALSLAAGRGHAGVCRKLLEAAGGAACVDVVDVHGDTALMRAMRGGHAEAVGVLVEMGADVRVRNKKGEQVFNIQPEVKRHRATLRNAMVDIIMSKASGRSPATKRSARKLRKEAAGGLEPPSPKRKAKRKRPASTGSLAGLAASAASSSSSSSSLALPSQSKRPKLVRRKTLRRTAREERRKEIQEELSAMDKRRAALQSELHDLDEDERMEDALLQAEAN